MSITTHTLLSSHIYTLSNHRPSSVPPGIFCFYPNLRKVFSAEPVQLAALHQWGGNKERILITKKWQPPCCSYQHGRHLCRFFMFWILWNVSEDTFVPLSTLRLLLNLDRLYENAWQRVWMCDMSIWDTGCACCGRGKALIALTQGTIWLPSQSYNWHVCHSLSLIRMCASVCLLLFCNGNICAPIPL